MHPLNILSITIGSIMVLVLIGLIIYRIYKYHNNNNDNSKSDSSNRTIIIVSGVLIGIIILAIVGTLIYFLVTTKGKQAVDDCGNSVIEEMAEILNKTPEERCEICECRRVW